MPPPTAAEKEKTAELVASLPAKEQAELLAQALLREYMHRRGFSRTLAAFDGENPRDERAIASRAIMKRLLNIPVDGRPSRLQPASSVDGRTAGKERGKAPAPAPTFMEELCSYRLTKRDYTLAGVERRRVLAEKHRMQEDGRWGVDLARAGEVERRLGELPEDPSDHEMSELRTHASTALERSQAAAQRREAYAALQAEARELAAALAALPPPPTRLPSDRSSAPVRGPTVAVAGDDGSDGSDTGSDSGGRVRRKDRRGSGDGEDTGSSDSAADSARAQRRAERRRKKLERQREKEARREERRKAKERARGSVDAVEAVATVGSRWAPPGLAAAVSSTSASGGGWGGAVMGSRSGGGGALAGEESRGVLDSRRTSLERDGGESGAAAAASRPERPVYVTGGGGSGLRGIAGAGAMPLVSREEITEVWQPRGGGGGRALSHGSATGSSLAPPSTMGRSLGGVGLMGGRPSSTGGAGFRAGDGGGDSSMSLDSAGGLSLTRRSSDGASSGGLQTASSQYGYDRSAQPLASALASSGRYGSGSGGGGGAVAGGAKRTGIGFNLSGAAARPTPSSFSGSASLGSAAGVRPPQPGISAEATAPGSDGVRHGFGFHKAPAAGGIGGAGGGADGSGGRKARKVTLLVD